MGGIAAAYIVLCSSPVYNTLTHVNFT